VREDESNDAPVDDQGVSANADFIARKRHDDLEELRAGAEVPSFQRKTANGVGNWKENGRSDRGRCAAIEEMLGVRFHVNDAAAMAAAPTMPALATTTVMRTGARPMRVPCAVQVSVEGVTSGFSQRERRTLPVAGT